MHAVCFVYTFQFRILRTLAQLYIHHGSLSQNWTELFLADIPVLGEHDEQEATVTYQMLADPDCDMGNVVTIPINGHWIIWWAHLHPLKTAFKWVKCQLDFNKPLQVAVGSAGTGKSYLLKELVQLHEKKQLVVAKLASSGVAATIHNFFSLDIDFNSTLENGNVEAVQSTLRPPV